MGLYQIGSVGWFKGSSETQLLVCWVSQQSFNPTYNNFSAIRHHIGGDLIRHGQRSRQSPKTL